MFCSSIDDLLEDILNPQPEIEKVAEIDAEAVQRDIEAQLALEGEVSLTKQASELAALKILAFVDAITAASK